MLQQEAMLSDTNRPISESNDASCDVSKPIKDEADEELSSEDGDSCNSHSDEDN